MVTKITSIEELGGEVTIVEADKKLQRKIGAPLNTIFTKQRIESAEKVVASKSGELIARCTDDAVKLKQMFVILQNEKNTSTTNYREMKLVALGIKSASGLGGFPLASDVARSLYEYMERLKSLDDKQLAIIKFHVDSIYAIFSENRRDRQDAIAQEVINELRKITAKN